MSVARAPHLPHAGSHGQWAAQHVGARAAAAAATKSACLQQHSLVVLLCAAAVGYAAVVVPDSLLARMGRQAAARQSVAAAPMGRQAQSRAVPAAIKVSLSRGPFVRGAIQLGSQKKRWAREEGGVVHWGSRQALTAFMV